MKQFLLERFSPLLPRYLCEVFYWAACKRDVLDIEDRIEGYPLQLTNMVPLCFNPLGDILCPTGLPGQEGQSGLTRVAFS